MAALQLTFATSADEPARLQDSSAEVAVVGRSNVGKSSLLNALANQRQLARTSNTPGRTQLLNQFRLRDGGTLVDLPGYGYAKAPKDVRTAWRRRMNAYLEQRDPLVMVMVLVDGAVGPTDLDLEMLARLRGWQRDLTVVATKLDKVKSSQRDRRRTEVARACGVERDDVVWVSATKGDGIDTLRRRVRAWIG
jgi:GTP-binding protein